MCRRKHRHQFCTILPQPETQPGVQITDSHQIQLATLVTTGDFADGNTVTVPLTAGLGGSTANAYFLKFISAASGGTVINYSDRFTLSSMTGTFPAAVITGLRTVTGTAGPADVNNIVAGGGQAAPNAPPAAVPSAGDPIYDTPYTMQSGTIRYAPMPPMAQTKITAKNAVRLFPTSAYTVYKKIAGTPNAITTNTAALTFSVVSIEPTVSPRNSFPPTSKS